MTTWLGPSTPTGELAEMLGRRRAGHRMRAPIRGQSGPVDPARLPHPSPGPYADNETSARRRRAARLQHRRRRYVWIKTLYE